MTVKISTLILITLIFFAIACTDKLNLPVTGPEPFTDFIGRWHLKTIHGVPFAKVVLQSNRFLEDERFFNGDPKGSLTTNLWDFAADGTWTADVKLVAESNGIRLTKLQKASGTFTISGFNYEMITKEAKTTIIVVIDGDETIWEKDDSSSLGTDTGTWKRLGNTLTFNVTQSENGQLEQPPDSVAPQPDDQSYKIVFTSDEDDVATVEDALGTSAGADAGADD